MAVRATFTGFDPYKLSGVILTDRELGHGSFATVLELEYMGLKCAGKKIHEVLLRQGYAMARYTLQKFEEECRLLSQLRHPNIVQFLGVFFQQGVRVPILVMEFLPINLTSYITQYGILPEEISYSILHDVALGLCCLHSQTPAIIHRDLSCNNILLTPNMTAKISDLGVARILNLTLKQASRMSQTPGTPAYMPPEVMVANPKYDTSIDEFSYGIMMIHMFSGRWPEPQVGPVRTEPDGTMIPVSEAERREEFLRAIGNDHSLMDLILKCINNHPQARAHASEIVKQLAEMVLQFPASFANRLEMMRHIKVVEEEKKALAEEGVRKDRVIQQKEEESLICRKALSEEVEKMDRVIQRKNSQILFHEEKARAKEEMKTAEIDHHSSEVEQLRLQVRDLNTQKQLVTAKMEVTLAQIKLHTALYESQIKNKSKTLIWEREQLKKMIAKEREKSELQIAHEREINQKLTVDIQKLSSEKNTLRCTILELQADIIDRDSVIQMKDASTKRKDSELEATSRALEEKDATISAMSEQLTKTRAREYLTTKQQSLQASIACLKCQDLPAKMCGGQSVVIDGKVYHGGGETENEDACYIVQCYDPSQDEWTTLPPLPVRYFGLGQINGQLVAVGGEMKLSRNGEFERSSHVQTFDGKVWKETLPPMSSALLYPAVISHKSMLVVAGGEYFDRITRSVEIFRLKEATWYRTHTNFLQNECFGLSIVSLDSENKHYALGGTNNQGYLNQAMYVSTESLCCNATELDSSTSEMDQSHFLECLSQSMQPLEDSPWKSLPNTVTYSPAASTLGGSLVAIGGWDTADRERSTVRTNIMKYSSGTNSWIYVADLPSPRAKIAAAVLSPAEVLVIGGWDDTGMSKVVYKLKLLL